MEDTTSEKRLLGMRARVELSGTYTWQQECLLETKATLNLQIQTHWKLTIQGLSFGSVPLMLIP